MTRHTVFEIQLKALHTVALPQNNIISSLPAGSGKCDTRVFVISTLTFPEAPPCCKGTYFYSSPDTRLVIGLPNCAFKGIELFVSDHVSPLMAAVITLVTPRWIPQAGHIKQPGPVLFFDAWSHICLVISPHSKVFIWWYGSAMAQKLLWALLCLRCPTHFKGAIKTKDRQANTHTHAHTVISAKELTAIRGSEIGSGYFQQLPDSLGDLEAKPLSRFSEWDFRERKGRLWKPQIFWGALNEFHGDSE